MAHNHLPRGGVDPEVFAGALRARVPAKPAAVEDTIPGLEQLHSSMGPEGTVPVSVLRDIVAMMRQNSAPAQPPIIIMPERRQVADDILRPRRSRRGAGIALGTLLIGGAGAALWFVGHRAQATDRPLVERGSGFLVDYDAANNVFLKRTTPEVRFVLDSVDDGRGQEGVVTYDISLKNPDTLQDLPISTFTDMLVSKDGVSEPSQTQCEISKFIVDNMFRPGDKQLAPGVQVELVTPVNGTGIDTVLATMTVGEEGC